MSRLSLLLAALALTGCDLISSEYLCLSRVLEVAEMTAEDLSGAKADAKLKAGLATARAILGDLPVFDCAAADSFEALGYEEEETGVAGVASAALGGEDAREPGMGRLARVWDTQELPEQTSKFIDDGIRDGGEVAILLDTTGSMQDDTQELHDNLDVVISSVEARKGRLSVVFFGDNQGCDSPWYQRNEGGLLSPEDKRISEAASDWRGGLTNGCDWPESLYDAAWKTATELEWTSDSRLMIVITDAEAQEEKTNHSHNELMGLLKEKGIVMEIILVGVGY